MTLAAVDIETYDPRLKQWGSGAIRKDGEILGVGIYCPTHDIKGYYDIHSDTVRNILRDKNITKVFHNGVYDLDWLINGYDLQVNGDLEDTMTREALLDSYALSYGLDASCLRRGVAGKNKGDTIDDWWKKHNGKGKAIEHLKEIPRDIVAKYCIQDCVSTYDLFNAQIPLLQREGLNFANKIEVRLYPFLMQMRGTGFRLDWDKRRELSDKMNNEFDRLQLELNTKYGFDVNINSNKHLETIWNIEKIPLIYTEKGTPSFSSEVLADCTHPLAQQIHHMKALAKSLSTFIDGGFMDQSYEGRLWSTFYPAKRDDGGTVTGRWSSQNINLQQIPAREDKFGPEVRSLFIPEENCFLGAFDFKQIEYRVFTHFAIGEGAASAKHKYNTEDNVDYHAMVQHMMGWDYMGKKGRYITKNLNFGSIYGLGYRSFARKFKWNLMAAHPQADPLHLEPLAQSLMNEYFQKIPFVRPTQQKIQEVCSQRGYLVTVAGRRIRIPPDLKMYKVVNYLVQGSAADIFKKALADAYDDGVFDYLYPHAVVHDEIVFSGPKDAAGVEAAEHLYECMTNAYKLDIPIGVDTEIGPDWGHCNEDNWNKLKEEVNG